MFAAGSGDFGVGVFGSMVTNRITSCGSDPEPSFQFNVDPDLTIHFNVDLDPAPHHSDANLRPLVYRPFTASF